MMVELESDTKQLPPSKRAEPSGEEIDGTTEVTTSASNAS
jgi:hypothetical protein